MELPCESKRRVKAPGLTQRELVTLAEARHTYGYGRQISVCCEELCELASVLNKYIRYDTDEKAVTELYGKVLEEISDVYVVLNHVRSIFHLADWEIESVMDSKLERMERWLKDSQSMEQTTVDRSVYNTSEKMFSDDPNTDLKLAAATVKHNANTKECETCYWWEHIDDPDCPCRTCDGTPKPPKLMSAQELKPNTKG